VPNGCSAVNKQCARNSAMQACVRYCNCCRFGVSGAGGWRPREILLNCPGAAGLPF